MPVAGPADDDGGRLGYDLGLARACGADRERVASARFRLELRIENGIGNGSRLAGFEQGMLNGRAVRNPAPAECARVLAALDAILLPPAGTDADASQITYRAVAPRSGVPVRLIYARADGPPAEWLIEAHGLRGLWRPGPGGAPSGAPVFEPRFIEAQLVATGQSTSFAVSGITRIGPANGPLTTDVAGFLRRLAAGFRG